VKVERRLAEWVTETSFDDLPSEPIEQAKTLVKTIVGTTIAGAATEGCAEIVEQVRLWGGREEATIHIYGGKVPAHAAVLANSTIARALDICDGSDPGIHIGASLVPVGLATAELIGGCSGEELLSALVVGTELTMRMGLIAEYDGFDPTGIGTVFGAAAVTGRLLGLTQKQMLDALALAFNRTGGSFQCNIDGSLAVRAIQGFVSQNGVICAQLAQRGITGPENFIEGRFGYYHLYAKDKRDEVGLIGDLGSRWAMLGMGFKAYPSCGATIASTDATLALVREHQLKPDDVESIAVAVSPPCYRLVGHEFTIGDNPTVDAQFNIRYCVANGILRKSSVLRHFDAGSVRDPRIMELTKKISVIEDPDINEGRRDLLSRVVMRVQTTSGGQLETTLDHPSGFPGNLLTPERHMERFWDNVEYGGKPLSRDAVNALVASVDGLEAVDDVRALVPLLVSASDEAVFTGASAGAVSASV
jgi:2-methylcitrate dehydratase PrpD